ncbi:hypothetical protein [Amycolatopsis dongchuanensis]|uniref:Acyl-CoA thioester hydrolase n=1 Tax=Amycolatopsis dongchuanensis TaxID=1070866 RepID=A0ABP9PRX0_9PSEU
MVDYPVRTEVHIRQADRGRDGAVSTVGLARCLEDARLRIRMRRFEQLVLAGGFEPFQILLVSQAVDRLAPVGPRAHDVEVHTGVQRIGRSSFTYGQAVFHRGERVGSAEATVVLAGAGGPLPLPGELLADLGDLRLPEQPPMPRPDAERHRRGSYAHHYPLRARIGDVDSNQHVNYLALVTWYDEAVAAFTAEALGGVPDLPPLSYRIQYTGEVTYPGDYEIGLSVRGSGTDQVAYRLAVFRGGTALGVADAVGPRGELPDSALED